MSERFVLALDQIQPSQLYVSAAKLEHVQAVLDPDRPESLAPLPVKRLGGWVIFTDGHTRAVAAHLAGWTHVPVYWDLDELDWDAYQTCVDWCRAAGIRTVADLAGCIVSQDEYDRVWLQRCARMHAELAARRAAAAGFHVAKDE